jgi:hypothetical protein
MESKSGHESGEVFGGGIGSAEALMKRLRWLGWFSATIWIAFFGMLVCKLLGIFQFPWWVIVIPLVLPFVIGLLVVVIIEAISKAHTLSNK